MNSGVAQPNSNWEEELFVGDISYGIQAKKNADDAEDSYIRIVNFFRARRGRGRGFLFRDPLDYEGRLELVYPQPGDNERRFELYKTYTTYRRRITRPDKDTVILYGDGVLIPANQYEILGKGVIVLNNGIDIPDVIKADFEYDIPVRFDQDELMVTLVHIEAGNIPAIKIVQVRE